MRAHNQIYTAAAIRRARLDHTKVVSTRLPEVGQFLDLLQSVQRNCVESECNGLAAHVQGLHV